jgi:hypothetical protein
MKYLNLSILLVIVSLISVSWCIKFKTALKLDDSDIDDIYNKIKRNEYNITNNGLFNNYPSSGGSNLPILGNSSSLYNETIQLKNNIKQLKLNQTNEADRTNITYEQNLYRKEVDNIKLNSEMIRGEQAQENNTVVDKDKIIDNLKDEVQKWKMLFTSLNKSSTADDKFGRVEKFDGHSQTNNSSYSYERESKNKQQKFLGSINIPEDEFKAFNNVKDLPITLPCMNTGTQDSKLFLLGKEKCSQLNLLYTTILPDIECKITKVFIYKLGT